MHRITLTIDDHESTATVPDEGLKHMEQYHDVDLLLETILALYGEYRDNTTVVVE